MGVTDGVGATETTWVGVTVGVNETVAVGVTISEKNSHDSRRIATKTTLWLFMLQQLQNLVNLFFPSTRNPSPNQVLYNVRLSLAPPKTAKNL
jgi:hypothetical protein